MEEFHQEGSKIGPFFPNLFFGLTFVLRLVLKSPFLWTEDFNLKDDDSFYLFDQLMNISPHLIIDAVILSIALTITLVLRAKGNAARKSKENK